MAMFCINGNNLFTYFLLIIFSSVFCVQNEYFYYKSDFNSPHDFYLEDLEDDAIHILYKREIPMKKQTNYTFPLNNNNINTLLINNSTNNTSFDKITLDIKSIPENKTLTAKTNATKVAKKVLQSDNGTKVVVEEATEKLLGANGTGIRKNITLLTTVPPVLTVPLNEGGFNDEGTFPPDDQSLAFNKTLGQHNITNLKEDHHFYYNSTITNSPHVTATYWKDLRNNPDAKINEILSKSHRRAATVQLNFTFPFYGHKIKNVTIATGGFIYTGDYVHTWLAATQYIAPLMANFDTSISNDSFIRYYDSGDAFTVEWENVALQDKTSEGEFTFQTTIHENGDIVFVYKTIPTYIKNITDDVHPVKVGLSDAYIIDRTIFLVRRKTIYEYHRINFGNEEITNGTVIYLTALPTCNQHTDCVSCVTKDIPSFQCIWCPVANRCSSGIDRQRQDWLTNRCQMKQLSESDCSHISPADVFDPKNKTLIQGSNEYKGTLADFSNANALAGSSQPVKMSVSSIIAILLLIAMVSGLSVWVLYAYRNPHTTSGQILIKYRPSQWRWRRGEARYTAATIHM